MEKEIEINYEFENIIYKIIGTEEDHRILQSDPKLFAEYVATHAATLEMEAPNICTQDGDSFVWTSKNVLLLLDEIEKVKLDLRNPKIRKRDIWRRIKDSMCLKGVQNITEEIIERKFRNMKATFKNIKDNKKKTSTGRGDIKWDYYDIMDTIFAEDKTINMGHTISSLSNRTLDVIEPHSPDEEFLNEVPESPIPIIASQLPKQNAEKREKAKQLYGLRKRQLDAEDSRLQELALLRKAIEENNKMQAERNILLKHILRKHN